MGDNMWHAVLFLYYLISLFSLLFTYKMNKGWKPFTVGMHHIVIIQ